MDKFLTILSGVGTLILMVAVFAGAYYVSKYISKKYQPKYGSGKNIEIIERTVLGKNQTLTLVKVSGRVFLIGCTEQNINKIEEFDETLFPELPESSPEEINFLSVFSDAYKNVLSKKTDRKGKDNHE